MNSLSQTAPWRSVLEQAIERNGDDPTSHYLQLATIGLDGRPANRTVAYRGFFAGTNRLRFTTDSRTRKFAELGLHPYGELCWYFAKVMQQFRIAGRFTLVTDQHPDAARLKARAKFWVSLAERTRKRMYWPDPRKPREPNIAFDIDPTPTLPPSNFCMLLLDAATVDHLDISVDPPNRRAYKRDEAGLWVVESLNP